MRSGILNLSEPAAARAVGGGGSDHSYTLLCRRWLEMRGNRRYSIRRKMTEADCADVKVKSSRKDRECISRYRVARGRNGGQVEAGEKGW